MKSGLDGCFTKRLARIEPAMSPAGTLDQSVDAIFAQNPAERGAPFAGGGLAEAHLARYGPCTHRATSALIPDHPVHSDAR